MRKHLTLIVAGLLLFAAGCQPIAAPIMGILYLDVKAPMAATQGTATKEGKACARSIMGLVGTGDASIDAAKKAGGIQEVAWVDYHSTSTLGIISDFCTTVHGK